MASPRRPCRALWRRDVHASRGGGGGARVRTAVAGRTQCARPSRAPPEKEGGKEEAGPGLAKVGRPRPGLTEVDGGWRPARHPAL